ncbi:hypothetical protein GGTG_07145 [Gaeumannomyces tritici R3-111a-1]|uniref:Uncharacterized protein n=1 Tax=Gaeumannomyces tritici (strain R3-111a-1) TaxID=644352 RepID=J3P0U9_GAET3|nr:hypothetical protein GGTG_07145 [Gaeumannomyces tritici R3-111a-1]EJT77233.1 hypothetical protein GGTG_07145 [Gaeumannomyces tritici R3-111a-1]
MSMEAMLDDEGRDALMFLEGTASTRVRGADSPHTSAHFPVRSMLDFDESGPPRPPRRGKEPSPGSCRC